MSLVTRINPNVGSDVLIFGASVPLLAATLGFVFGVLSVKLWM
jgi:hypothetical protein